MDAPLMERRSPAQKVIVGAEAFGGLALDAVDLSLFQCRRNRPDDARGYPILQIKDVLGRAIKPIRPEMGGVHGLDQLPGDAQPIGRLSNTSFEYIADPELAADLSDIYGPALVGKGGI